MKHGCARLVRALLPLIAASLLACWSGHARADAPATPTTGKAAGQGASAPKRSQAPLPQPRAKPASSKSKKKTKKKPQAIATVPDSPTPVAAPAAEPPAVEPPAAEPPVPSAARPPEHSSAKVDVPSSSHVTVDVPEGLQGWLDADQRMRPWLAKAIAAADGCYVDQLHNDARLAGVVTFSLTMHQNARPTARVISLPAAFQGMVLCVTSNLIGEKMPLFTGKEGERYTVSVHLEP
jgi:hypothetical protein